MTRALDPFTAAHGLAAGAYGSPFAARAAAAARAKIPADIDAPDRVAFDLTFRQLAVLVSAGLTGLVVWTVLARTASFLPAAVRAVALVPLAGVALALAVGRRDGLPLDTWLTAAAVFRRRPRRLTSAAVTEPPSWAPVAVPRDPGPPSGARPSRRGPALGGARRGRRPAAGSDAAGGHAAAELIPRVLRLPVDAIDADGTVHHQGGRGREPAATVLVAASTVNVTLRTPSEQAALVAGVGRWLNGLTTPVQVVISTRRVDLAGHATRLARRARQLADEHLAHQTAADDQTADGDLRRRSRPSAVDTGDRGSWDLAAAAADHAQFLVDLAADRDPLARTVVIAATALGGPAPAVAARRTAEHTAASLATLGGRAVLLDGATATAVLASATDPYQAGDAGWPRTPPGDVVVAKPSAAWACDGRRP